MTIIHDTIVRPGEHLVFEVHPDLCRQKITLKAGMKYPTGLVLGKVTATGEYTEYDPAATDGTQTVAGVLYAGVNATAGAKPGVRHHALTVMLKSKLAWKSGLTDAQKTAAINALSATHIAMSLEVGAA
jgi:hypothetical protein